MILYECLYGYPPFVSNTVSTNPSTMLQTRHLSDALYLQRHQTRQMILNWSRHLKFPAQPKISPEAIDLLKLLLCEPEHRLGSQAISSVIRSNSVRMSVYGLSKSTRSVDGADSIKVRSASTQAGKMLMATTFIIMYRRIPGLKVSTGGTFIVSRRHSVPISATPLIQSTLMMIFQLRSVIIAAPILSNPYLCSLNKQYLPAISHCHCSTQTLPPANGGPPDATKDPLLKDILMGDKILDSRKQYAFVGFTHKSPRAITYPRVDTLMTPHAPRGRNVQRAPSARSRALSL